MSDLRDHELFLELPLRRACMYSDDAGLLWTKAMPEVIERFGMSPSEYWNLTVAEVAFFVEHLSS